jgi:hypothetical protein
VVAPERTSVRRRGPGPQDMWQHRSSPHQGGKVRSRGTCDNAGAHLSKEAISRAMGHVVASEPTSAGRCGLKLQLTWQRVDARPAPCLDLELVCEGTRSSGYRQTQHDQAIGLLNMPRLQVVKIHKPKSTTLITFKQVLTILK